MNRPKKLDLKNLISWGGSKNPAFFYFTGNFVEFSCEAGLFLIFLIAPKRTEC